MLDADTKRRIDSCRDILVGKVPDPKSQVEQITIALIYKPRRKNWAAHALFSPVNTPASAGPS